MKTPMGARGILVVLGLVLLSSVHAREILQDSLDDILHHGGSNGDCEEPPDGDWLVSHNFPSAPENNTLALQIRTLMSLRKVLDNVYQGSAGGVVVNPELPVLTAGQPVVYNFNGIWDQDTCSMSGVILNFDALIADPVRLVYDGETLTGPYLNTDNGQLLFSRTGVYSLTLVAPY